MRWRLAHDMQAVISYRLGLCALSLACCWQLSLSLDLDVSAFLQSRQAWHHNHQEERHRSKTEGLVEALNDTLYASSLHFTSIVSKVQIERFRLRAALDGTDKTYCTMAKFSIRDMITAWEHLKIETQSFNAQVLGILDQGNLGTLSDNVRPHLEECVWHIQDATDHLIALKKHWVDMCAIPWKTHADKMAFLNRDAMIVSEVEIFSVPLGRAFAAITAEPSFRNDHASFGMLQTMSTLSSNIGLQVHSACGGWIADIMEWGAWVK